MLISSETLQRGLQEIYPSVGIESLRPQDEVLCFQPAREGADGGVDLLSRSTVVRGLRTPGWWRGKVIRVEAHWAFVEDADGHQCDCNGTTVPIYKVSEIPQHIKDLLESMRRTADLAQ